MTNTLKQPDVARNSVQRTLRNRTQSSEQATRLLQFLGALLVAASVVVAVFSSGAGASSLSNGTVALTAPTSNVVETNPLSNKQVIAVNIEPNSTLARSSLEAAGFPSGATPIKVAECADPGGLASNLPTKPTDCEPLTVEATSHIAANGSLRMNFTIFALPDINDLGSSNGTKCDDGADQCVLGIFSNQNDFTKPHLFSGPFQVNANTVATASPTTGGGTTTEKGTVSAGVSLPPSTLAFTGSPTIWPWLLGSGILLLAVGTGMRMTKRRRIQ